MNNEEKREKYFNLFVEKDLSMKEYREELNLIKDKLEKCKSKKYKKFYLTKKIFKIFKKNDIIDLNHSLKTISFGFCCYSNKLFLVPKTHFQEKDNDIVDVIEQNFKKFCKNNNLEYINKYGIIRPIK